MFLISLNNRYQFTFVNNFISIEKKTLLTFIYLIFNNLFLLFLVLQIDKNYENKNNFQFSLFFGVEKNNKKKQFFFLKICYLFQCKNLKKNSYFRMRF